jgi:hypothetical protein
MGQPTCVLSFSKHALFKRPNPTTRACANFGCQQTLRKAPRAYPFESTSSFKIVPDFLGQFSTPFAIHETKGDRRLHILIRVTIILLKTTPDMFTSKSIFLANIPWGNMQNPVPTLDPNFAMTVP